MQAILPAYQWSGGVVPEVTLTWKEDDRDETVDEFADRVKRTIKHRLDTWEPIAL